MVRRQYFTKHRTTPPPATRRPSTPKRKGRKRTETRPPETQKFMDYQECVRRQWTAYECGTPSWIRPCRKLTSSGYIYMVAYAHEYENDDCDTVRVKIGKTTTTPKQRLEQMRTGSPDELILIDADWFPVMHEYERWIHARLRNRRVRGEWFLLTRDELDDLSEGLDADADWLYHGFNFWSHDPIVEGSRVDGLFDPEIPAHLTEMYRRYQAFWDLAKESCYPDLPTPVVQATGTNAVCS